MNFRFSLLIIVLLFSNTLIKIIIMRIINMLHIILKTTSPKLMKKSNISPKWPKMLSLSHYLT